MSGSDMLILRFEQQESPTDRGGSLDDIIAAYNCDATAQ
ncbi:hypothetical protein N018_02210 [Pseudomonas syringae CC1557]|uniref:Uncharacterized protein n=1 Tax=Pseudomonas syringae CC1557 TaxID=1357279 RepID=W0MYI5_PSESX|nr:hypothetical protein N018_02210 [Pseudomonas syringae CC1557]